LNNKLRKLRNGTR